MEDVFGLGCRMLPAEAAVAQPVMVSAVLRAATCGTD